MTNNGGDGGSGVGVEPLEDDDPRRIGPIPLVGRLGAGGMGRVYLGVYEGRYAAVKQVRPSLVAEDQDFVRRFGHELDNLARLPAGATAPLLAGDRDARPPWFATAYVPGLTLREAVEVYGGPLPAESLWLLLREAAAGLAAVHERDMVHRDIKPSNVMLTSRGLTLIDFGVARAAEQSQLTRTGMVVGTPAYMSPEQASGARRLTGAVDVFALGSVVAFAGSGRPPFGDESGHGVLYRIVHEQPDLQELRDADPELAELVGSCLDKDPEGRPTTAELLELTAGRGPSGPPLWPEPVNGRLAERAAFAADVPEVTAAEPEVVIVPPDRERERRPGRRRTLVLAVAVPVVIVATATFQLLPYATGSRDDHDGGTAATPASSASASTSPSTPSSSPRTSTSPTGTASPSASGRGKGSDKSDKDGGNSGKTAAGGTGRTGGDSGSASAGSGGSSTSGASSGSSGSSHGSTSGSSASGGSSGGTTVTTTPSTSGSSGAVTLKNGENGKCLIQVYGSSGLGSCSDATAEWTFRSASGGSVKVVNVSTGACLSANGNGQAVFVGDCSLSSTARLWKTGTGNTLATVYDGGCLALAFGGGVAEATCAPGAASQSWARG
ncbi:protein kinase [Streptomyces sp. NPDC048281]|uniref:serine/threonine-protein kinase n=1 Tax=Streptomyces sp. NPDC048281 TaxID=3154715 RepID=UPI00343C6D05